MEYRTVEGHYDDYKLINTETKVDVIAEAYVDNETKIKIKFCEIKE